MSLHLVLVGLGNIGSHLAPHLARIPEVARLTLIDPGRYEPPNLAGQSIEARDLGRTKVEAVAQRLLAVRPELCLVPVASQVEDVPLGRLRADVLLTCTDGRASRQRVSEAACRLGIPWVDAGVRAEAGLARVTVLAPGPAAPCGECGWSEGDYAALTRHALCGADGRSSSPPTHAPPEMGALAAALQAAACRRLLSGDRRQVDRELRLDLERSCLVATALRRNPCCRFDHRRWAVTPLGRGPCLTFAELHGGPTLRIEGGRFVASAWCNRCGESHLASPVLEGRKPLRCPRCHGSAVVSRLLPELAVDGIAAETTLSALGLSTGDVFATGGRHFEVGDDPG